MNTSKGRQNSTGDKMAYVPSAEFHWKVLGKATSTMKQNAVSAEMMISMTTKATPSTRYVIAGVTKSAIAKALILITFLTLASCLQLNAQAGAVISGQVVSLAGVPTPYAQVRICASTASGNPCTPLSAIYADAALSTPLSNPTTADANGFFSAFVANTTPFYLVQTYPSGAMYAYYANGAFGGASVYCPLSGCVQLAPSAAQQIAGYSLGVSIPGGTPPTLPTATVIDAINSGADSRITTMSFGGVGRFTAATAGGTKASPTALTSGSEIGGFNGYAYNGTSFIGPLGAFRVFTGENQSSGHGGTYVDVTTTPSASTTPAEVQRWNGDGGSYMVGATGGDEGSGTLNAAGLYVNGAAVGALPGAGVVYSSGSAFSDATYQQMATAQINSSTGNMLLASTNPSAPGDYNLIEGYGAGPSITTTGNAYGGQYNVIMGYEAGAAATTMREAVLIGNQAGSTLTGSGAGTTADDTIMTCIGSYACGGVVAGPSTGAGVFVGQKAGISITSSANDVVVGTHAFPGVVTSTHNTVVGASVVDVVTALTGTYAGNTLIGSLIGNGATNGSFSYNFCGGYASCYDLNSATYNVAIGEGAGGSLTTGTYNTFLGAQGPGSVLGPGVTGSNNTFVGTGQISSSGFALTSGNYNIATGAGAGYNLSTGSENVLVGYLAGNHLATGSSNVILGPGAGQNATSAISNNVIVGPGAGQSSQNSSLVAVGASAGSAVTTGTADTMVGYDAGNTTTTGSNDTAIGDSALTGVGVSDNTAVGASSQAAGSNDTSLGYNANAGTASSGENIAVGTNAGYNMSSATSVTVVGYFGGAGITSGSDNSFFGAGAGQNATGTITHQAIFGDSAGKASTANYLTAIGSSAATADTSGAGTWVGYDAGVLVTSGTGNSGFGTSACDLLTTETNDTCVGDAAQIAATYTGSVELGPGTCSVSNALCIDGAQIADTSGDVKATGLVTSGLTAFTVSGCGTAGSVTGTGTVGSFTVGTGTTNCTFTVTLNGATGLTAAHGWVANADDTTAAIHCINATTVSTTTVVFTCTGTISTSDLIKFESWPY